MLNYWNASTVSRHHVESVNSQRAQHRVEIFIIYDCSFRASFISIVGLCTSRKERTGEKSRKIRVPGIISLIPTFLHATVTRTVRAIVIFTEITGRTMRKIVTAKDFEFSPRKESAAESTLSFPCMCMHYACTVALREKCLGNRKARGAVALSLFVSLFPPLCMRRYQSCIRCTGVRASIPGGPDARNFAGGLNCAHKIL